MDSSAITKHKTTQPRHHRHNQNKHSHDNLGRHAWHGMIMMVIVDEDADATHSQHITQPAPPTLSKAHKYYFSSFAAVGMNVIIII